MKKNESMNKLVRIFNPVGALVDRIVCVVFAVLLAQGPTYIAQYIDVLSGAEMEARRTFEDVQERAIQEGLTVEEYIARTVEETPREVRAWDFVQDTKNTVERYQKYHKALVALENSSLWARPFVLAAHFDRSIHKAIRFEPNVPITYEGAVYALIGVLLALSLMALVRGIIGLIFGRKKTSEKINV
ncbi:MAG: DUF2937 family protein [Bacteroidetes bacterium]|nr:MAG: DUF2937 family protein [Bacteroidota bacterium]